MRRSSLPKPVRDGLAIGTIILVIVALVGFAGAPRTLAASAPTPVASSFYAIQPWLDREAPLDAAPGSTIRIGITLWDTAAGELSLWVNVYVRLWPPGSVDGLPPKADIRNDWPGHLIATATVPQGGLGSIEVGLHGVECHPDGTCPLADIPMTIGGVGPPPGVPREKLITGSVSGIVDPVAGVPFDLTVDIHEKADWDPASLGLPDRIVAIARHPRGPDLETAELRRQGPAGQPYTGSVTLPEAGDMVVVAALPGNGAEDTVLPTTTTRLLVASAAGGGQPTGGGESAAGGGAAAAGATGAPRTGTNPAPVDAGGSGDRSLLLWIVGVGLVLVVTGLMVRRVFADL
jgi:hypothetical protein